MSHRIILRKLFTKPPLNPNHHHQNQHRWISATSHLNGWIDNVKGVLTGKKSTDSSQSDSSQDSFTLNRFADEMGRARKLGSLKQFVSGRGSSEATCAEAFEKHETILRCLGKFNPNGENLQLSQKQEAAKECKCTIADIENTLAKYTWAKEAQSKLQKLQAEGKPLPKSMEEVQKLMGSTPMDLARSNLAKSGNISRNAMCPCGSKKRYKRCCGEDKK